MRIGSVKLTREANQAKENVMPVSVPVPEFLDDILSLDFLDTWLEDFNPGTGLALGTGLDWQIEGGWAHLIHARVGSPVLCLVPSRLVSSCLVSSRLVSSRLVCQSVVSAARRPHPSFSGF
jgi:hypothetical protein